MISAVQPKDCRLEGVDLVVTGEGRTDWQSCFGKVMQGVPALSAAAMIHVGATVVDSLPHGSFFHATGGSVNMTIGDRMKLIPFEACVGLTSTIISVLLFCIIG